MASDERVQVGLEELQDLKGVWSELAKIWEKVDELKDKPWLSIQPRKVSVGELVRVQVFRYLVIYKQTELGKDNQSAVIDIAHTVAVVCTHALPFCFLFVLLPYLCSTESKR